MWRFLLKAFVKCKSDLLKIDKTEKAIVRTFRGVDFSQLCLEDQENGENMEGSEFK